MLNLNMLIQRPLTPITLLTSLNRTTIMPLNLPRRPPKSLLPVLLTLHPTLDLVPLTLELSEAAREFVTLVE